MGRRNIQIGWIKPLRVCWKLSDVSFSTFSLIGWCFLMQVDVFFVGIMIHMLYLMATHSSGMINYSEKKLFSSSRTFTQRTFHALSWRKKFRSWREKFTHFHAEKISFHAEKSSFHIEKSSRTFMQRKFHALSCRENFLSYRERFTHFHAEKSTHTWEILWFVHGISSTVFDPMVLVHGIASKSVDPKYWVHGIELLRFLVHGIVKGLRL